MFQGNHTTLEKAKLALLGMQRYPWEQGTAMQAFYEQGDMAVVVAMAKEAAYRAAEDGRVAMIGSFGGATDPCANGEGMLRAYELTHDPVLKTAFDRLLQWALDKAPRNEEGIVYHVTDAPQHWVDAMYMLPPFLAAAGEYEEAMKQLRGYWKIFGGARDGLLVHIWDDEKKEYSRNLHWGVGNGWALAGMARVIDLLPESMAADRQELIGYEKILIATLLNFLRADFFFHDVVDDPATFVETNLSQQLAYTLLRGVRSHWLGQDVLPLAQKIRAAVYGKVDAYGLVRDVCGAPSFDKPGVAPEGQAFFLMMEAEAAKLGP